MDGSMTLQIEGQGDELLAQAIRIALTSVNGAAQRCAGWRHIESTALLPAGIALMRFPRVEDECHPFPSPLGAEPLTLLVRECLAANISAYDKVRRPMEGGDGSHEKGWRIEADRDQIVVRPWWIYYSK